MDVVIIMGSKNDWPEMSPAATILKDFEITHESRVLSAHRTPHELENYLKEKKEQGLKVVIAGAGGAAHLAGVCASYLTIPVLGVPINSTPLNGMDSLLATVQMPAGIPVATFSIGKPGAKNAALFAVSLLAISSLDLSEKLKNYRTEQSKKVLEVILD